MNPSVFVKEIPLNFKDKDPVPTAFSTLINRLPPLFNCFALAHPFEPKIDPISNTPDPISMLLPFRTSSKIFTRIETGVPSS